ncbi:MAG: polysaccharide biosynthesis tyrosine autokinase [Chloroflexi bacterium]|nr:polysaccharide biosynthesis tyrosine autokinase [Chloroflexota bacterium]
MKQASSPIAAILKLLVRWWWLVALSVALGVGVGFLVRTNQPNIYVATTRVLFGQNLAGGSTTSVSSLQELRDLITIYSGLVRLPTILQPVIDDLGLGINVDQLNYMMSINVISDLPILEIKIADTQQGRAADIANRIAQELIRQSPTEQVSQETTFKREQLANIQKQIEELQKQYDANIAQGGTLTSAFEIAQNLQERAALLENLQQLRTTYAEMSAGLADRVQFLRIFEFARPENTAVITSSMISVILAGAGGLVLSLTTIVLLAYFDDRLTWQEGQEIVDGVKVLGPLGKVPKQHLPLYLITIPQAVESEVMRQLRAKLVLAAGGVVPRVLTVTSYDSGDGKTVTSSNLALAFAQAGQRTLLIDGDLRKGNLHEIFHLPNVMGLSDVLASHDDLAALLSRALLESGYDHLTILTSGRSTADAAALLSGPRFCQLIDLLKSQFDVLIMDSVPTVGGPDSAFMAEVSEGVLIIADSRRTTGKALQRTLHALQQARRVNIYGIAFNRVYLQVSSTYNRPYYRRTIGISPERMNRELRNAGKRGLNLNRHILTDHSGERLYSMKAAAIQLGISEDTLKDWIKVGYISAVRRWPRQWVRESDMQSLLERLPRRLVAFAVEQPSNGVYPEAAAAVDGDPSLPSRLRDQRNALLEFVGEAKPGEEPGETR